MPPEDSAAEFTRIPVGRFEWERILRRVVVSKPSTKLIGFIMATYASKDGTRVRPGQQRIAAVMGASLSTVERGQRELERLGLLELVFKGHSAGRGRAGGYASEYRLTIPDDLVERVRMLDPEEHIYPSPVLSDSDNHPAPVTGDSEDIPVTHEESPVMGAETPVKTEEIPVTHDGPSLHDQHINNHNKNHQSFKPHLSDAHTRDAQRPKEPTVPTGNGSGQTMTDEEDSLYGKSRDYLQGHREGSQKFMDATREEHPELSAKERVIAAAVLAGFEMEEAS